jgi:hypothetical protein
MLAVLFIPCGTSWDSFQPSCILAPISILALLVLLIRLPLFSFSHVTLILFGNLDPCCFPPTMSSATL